MLVAQAEAVKVPFLEEMPESAKIGDHFDAVIDAIFGFSFSGEIRAPFKDVIDRLGSSGVPILSVDIPSGWDLEKGNQFGTFTP